MADLTAYRDIVEKRAMLAYKKMYSLVSPKSSQARVFVSGMQRSGTNMLMEVLERSIHTDVFHERDPRAYKNYELLPFDTIHRLVKQSRHRTTVFKSLLESDMVPEILEEFRPAKAVWVFRNFQDVINSAERSFPHLRRTLYRIVNEPGDYWQSRGAHPRILEEIKKHYREDLSLTACVALFWYARTRLYFDAGLDRDERVILVNYQDLVTTPDPEIRRVFEFIGVPYSNWTIKRIHSHSVSKNPAPELPGGIRAICDQLYDELKRARAASG